MNNNIHGLGHLVHRRRTAIRACVRRNHRKVFVAAGFEDEMHKSEAESPDSREIMKGHECHRPLTKREKQQ